MQQMAGLTGIMKKLKCVWFILVVAVLSSFFTPFLANAAPERSFRVPILLYHRFGAQPADNSTISPAMFESHMRYLRDNGYSVIPLRRLVDYYYGKAPMPPPKSVVLVVDNAHESVYSDMYPVVRKFGYPVTLFVCPHAVGKSSVVMNWRQVRDLAQSGIFEIQSHASMPSLEHAARTIRKETLDRMVLSELLMTKARLKTELGVGADYVAWPTGQHYSYFSKTAAAAGYLAGFITTPRPATERDSIMLLPRYSITNATSRQLPRILEEVFSR